MVGCSCLVGKCCVPAFPAVSPRSPLEQSISQLEPESTDTAPIELADVTDALQRVDPIWEMLHPEEQRRVLELLVETITVSNDNVDVQPD